MKKAASQNDGKLWERVRKCELALQKVSIDLAAIGEELRTTEESQISEPKKINEPS